MAKMTIKECRTKKFTIREKLICQYAKEIIMEFTDQIKDAIKEGNGNALSNAIRDLKCEARMIGDNEQQLRNWLWFAQMI